MSVRAVLFLGCSLLVAVAMFGPAASGGQRARGVHRDSLGEAYPSSLWPKVNGVATVYYMIDPSSDPSATPKINTAIGTFNGDFPGLIQWDQWSSSGDGPNYVDIDLAASNPSGQCEALEGYEAVPAQAMGGSTACTVGTILHEMGHIIGLWHEQARPDASTYITTSFANVIKGSWSYFQPPPDNFQILASYDYASLMQYPSFDLSSNGGPVIETIPAGIPLNSSEGVPVPAKVDYSAGDKETIMRLYGAAPTTVTVTSNPVGLKVTVDGGTVITPHVYSWKLKSSHTLAVAAGVQTLTGDIAGSTTSATFYYTYGRWSNSTKASQTITVNPGNGELAFPATSPAIATYSANFIQLVPFSSSVYPAGSGQVSASPQPTTYPTGTGSFYIARQPITLTAQATSPYAFYEYNNAPFFLPGGLGLNPKPFYVPDTGNPVDPMVEFSDMPVYSVSLTHDYATSNAFIDIDGDFEYTPKNYSPEYDSGWTAGSMHTFSFVSPESPYSINSRFKFAEWNPVTSDARARGGVPPRFTGRLRARQMRSVLVSMRHLTPPVHGAMPPDSQGRGPGRMLSTTTYSETETLPSSSAGYGATVTRQFAPVTNFNYPPCGGTATLSPASPTGDGFYSSGQVLSFDAAAGSGWTFAGWTYSVTGRTNPATLTATSETLVFANFNTTTAPLVLTNLSPGNTVAGSADFTLTIKGKGFDTGSLVTFNGNYPAVTYVSSTELQATIPATYVAAPGNYQVAVENFPAGSDGCAVFGYAPFFVKAA